MKFNIFKTRNGKLRTTLVTNFLNKKIPDKAIESMMFMVDEYEKANLSTIDKLKKDKSRESKRISGALKQTIHAHGPITKELIGSATKRIYGSLLLDDNNNGDKITIHKSNFFLLCVLILISLIAGFIF